MNKAIFIDKLYNNLKDKIEFDEDVEALFKILTSMLKINQEKGIKAWLYLLNHYNLKMLQNDIDFTLLTQNYLLEILNYYDLRSTISLLSKIPIENRKIIENEFLNVFNLQSGIYKYFKKLIKNNQYQKEMNDLTYIIKGNFNKLIFDSQTLLKNIIIIHLKEKHIDINLLMKIARLSPNKKDQALLKSLFIDYI